MTVDTEALIAAVRAGDIEAAQALLPVDPIVKRAREICARHMGTPSRWLSGDHDDGPYMGAVTEALRATSQIEVDDAALTRMARAACYGVWQDPEYLSGRFDGGVNFERIHGAIQAALVGA